MAIYAIGDVQGCFTELQKLLEKIAFDPAQDQLWFTGDLVNRGPHSLETLRFVKSLDDRAITVLGNHDLHLLAICQEQIPPRKKDTLYDVLTAPDRDELIEWLRQRPLLHCDGRFCLIHAGLPPQWDLAQARACAAEAEEVLRGAGFSEFLARLYGDWPDRWSESLTGWDRLRFIINCFTRLRYCYRDGRLALAEKGAPGRQGGEGLAPWFEIPGRKTADKEIIFGHWSTLGFYADNNCFCLDTGCLWGGQLTALRLDDEMYRTSIDCPCYSPPG